jgi:hypothetical protein
MDEQLVEIVVQRIAADPRLIQVDGLYSRRRPALLSGRPQV